jgi:hypothetical protein
MATIEDGLKDLLSRYDAARLEFEALTASVARRFGDGDEITDADVLLDQEARTSLATARQEALVALSLFRHEPD